MNPFYKNHKQNQSGQPFDLQAALNSVAQFIAPTGLTPEQLVRQKIQNGEMTQAQFEQFSAIANKLTGRNS